MRHTEQEGAGGREEEVMLGAELATGAYRKSEMMRSGAAISHSTQYFVVNNVLYKGPFQGFANTLDADIIDNIVPNCLIKTRTNRLRNSIFPRADCCTD